MYSDLIRSTLDSFHEYVANNLPACQNHRAARVSPFWSEHFSDRRNFPDTSDFLAFRRGDYLYGIGDTKPSSPEQKQREFDDVCKSIQLFTPSSFIEKLREPYLGAPQVYPFGKASLSTSYVLNSGTTWRIRELINRHGPSNRPLHICEIGAGWGACASQLHQVCDVASYTIIDLPENLCLSSTYLAVTVPGKQHRFLDCTADTPAKPQAATLNFGLPAAIDNMPGRYDIIINTVSLQEMDRETVDAYFSWSATSLAKDGLLISFNAHDKAGVRRPSEYLHGGLSLVHMAPFRKVPAGYFNTIPYEMVFRPTSAAIPDELPRAVDALGEMIQLGLDGQLIPLAEAALSGTGLRTVRAQLSKLQAFFYSDAETHRQTLLEELLKEYPSAISSYLAGCYYFARGGVPSAQNHLDTALSQGLEGFAEIRARVLLAVIARVVRKTARPAQDTLTVLEAAAGGLLQEIEQIMGQDTVSALQDHIARVLDCPIETPLTTRALLGKVRRRLLSLK
jgi:putative sugar O-methyltransferase